MRKTFYTCLIASIFTFSTLGAVKAEVNIPNTNENGTKYSVEFHTLSREDMEKRLEERKNKEFSAVDANSDGKVSKTEFVEFHAKRINEKFDSQDADKDGFVSKEEMFPTRPAPRMMDRHKLKNIHSKAEN